MEIVEGDTSTEVMVTEESWDCEPAPPLQAVSIVSKQKRVTQDAVFIPISSQVLGARINAGSS